MPSYNAINARTLSAMIAADTANAQEVAWMAKIHVSARNYCPLRDWFSGLGGGRPVAEVMDTQKIAGQEIVAKVSAQLGQRGVQGDADRVGNEEKLKDKYFRVKIGALWHGVGDSKIALNQTAMGGKFDQRVQPLLAEWLAVRKVMDLEAEIFDASGIYPGTSTRNIVRPNWKGSTNALGSADVFSLATVTDVRDALLGINSKGLTISRLRDGQTVQKYCIQGTQHLFADLNRNSTYQDLLANAENRGPSNHVWAGGKPMVNGSILNEWLIDSNDADATQGCRMIPIAYTGSVIPADPDSAVSAEVTLLGGGNATAGANTKVDYFQNFHNAPYVGFEGTKIAAVTNVERYLAVRARGGAGAGKWRFFAYQVNDGNKITLTRALSSAAAGGTSITQTALTAASVDDKAEWTSPHLSGFLTEAEIPVGAEVYQCNAKGQILCYGIGIGDNALLCGYGSIDGQKAFGRRTTEVQDHQRLKAIGMEAVWGIKANEDANGNISGFVVIEAAYNPPGFPEIP